MARPQGFRGVLISPAVEKPDVVLTDFNNEPFNLRLKTAGKVTLLFFGYTHCPDVCPLHAANIAAVLKQMPFEERDQIVFVFVTTDPARDTPTRLKEWLGNFEPSFVGLSGPMAEVNRLQAGLNMAPAQLDAPANSATYLVAHSAQVLAFGQDSYARVEYPFGIRQEDWAQDLPRLARGEVPQAPPVSALAANAASGAPNAPATQPVDVAVALIPQPVSTSEAAFYVVPAAARSCAATR